MDRWSEFGLTGRSRQGGVRFTQWIHPEMIGEKTRPPDAQGGSGTA
jgi:hypothetical protein